MLLRTRLKRLAPRIRSQGSGKYPGMRAMFITWLTLIAAGVVLYTVVGLSHN